MKKLACLLLVAIFLFPTGCTTNNVKTSGNDISSETQNNSSAEITAPEHKEKDNSLYPTYSMVNSQQKYGYINAEGDFIIQPQYDYAYDFTEDVAIVYDQSEDYILNYKVIDKQGNTLFENSNVIDAFSNGAAAFDAGENYSTKYGYIDNKGNVIVQPKYKYAGKFNSENKAFVITDDKKGLVIDKSGKELQSYPLGDDKIIYDFKDGYGIFYGENAAFNGVIDYKGEMVIEPKYREIKNLGQGYFAIRQQSEDLAYTYLPLPFAFYNYKGQQLSDYLYYDANDFKDEFASASDETYTYFIDKQGQPVDSLPKIKGTGVLTLTGEFVKSDIEKELMYLTKDGELIYKADNSIKPDNSITVNKVKYKPARTSLIFYPVIKGLQDENVQIKINEQLKSLFIDHRKDVSYDETGLTVEDNFTVSLKNDLMVIYKTGYDYFAGAAHGMPLREYYKFNIKTGEFYELKDLFKQNSDYVTIISHIIANQMKEEQEQEDMFYFDDAFSEIDPNHKFHLTEDSMVIYFYPYDISAYAAGFPEFTIPYSDISDILDKEGSLWKSFN